MFCNRIWEYGIASLVFSVWLSRTDLVELNGVEFGALLGQKCLGLLAVRAVGFGEDGDRVLVDDGLHLGLGGGHCGGAGGAVEKAREEGYGCGVGSPARRGSAV